MLNGRYKKLPSIAFYAILLLALSAIPAMSVIEEITEEATSNSITIDFYQTGFPSVSQKYSNSAVHVQVYINDSRNIRIDLLAYDTEKIADIYKELLRVYNGSFYCLTYEGKRKMNPRRYFNELSKTTTEDDLLSSNIEFFPNTQFATIVLWTVAGIVSLFMVLSCLYYGRLAKRAKEIKKQRRAMRRGQSVSTTRTSSSSTLRSAQVKVSFVVIDSDIRKIEGDDDNPASCTEVRTVEEVKEG